VWYSTESYGELFGRGQVKSLVEKFSGVSAVVCYNDQIAFNLITELQNHSINVPGDISVIGIDNAEIAEYCEVPITTITNPVDELGKTLAQNILQIRSSVKRLM
jgi:GntR family transcriptional regulator of arabinose operon